MNTTTPPQPDLLVAFVRLQRLTSKILAVADELRQAQEDLQTQMAAPPAIACKRPHREGNRNAR